MARDPFLFQKAQRFGNLLRYSKHLFGRLGKSTNPLNTIPRSLAASLHSSIESTQGFPIPTQSLPQLLNTYFPETLKNNHQKIYKVFESSLLHILEFINIHLALTVVSSRNIFLIGYQTVVCYVIHCL